LTAINKMKLHASFTSGSDYFNNFLRKL
jgi:hypothetical protein